MEDLGLRPVMSPETLGQMLGLLASEPHTLADDYKIRQARIQEKLKTGLPISLAEVVRDLAWRKHADRLTKAEAAMLAEAQEQLATEMALVNGVEIAEAKAEITALLDAAAENHGTLLVS
jgi:CarD family transcriptional regulator